MEVIDTIRGLEAQLYELQTRYPRAPRSQELALMFWLGFMKLLWLGSAFRHI